VTILIIYEFADVPDDAAAAFRNMLLALDKYKGWMSDDDDGECHALPNTVVASLADAENEAQQDFEVELDKAKLREKLHSVIYCKLSASRLFFSASEIGDGECDWESKRSRTV
jgi:hypothetical protein